MCTQESSVGRGDVLPREPESLVHFLLLFIVFLLLFGKFFLRLLDGGFAVSPRLGDLLPWTRALLVCELENTFLVYDRHWREKGRRSTPVGIEAA